MKKLICILGLSLVLTGCSDSEVLKNRGISEEEIKQVSFESKNIYLNQEVKEIINEINKLSDKYKKNIEEGDFYSIYINIHDKEDLYNLKGGFFIDCTDNFYDDYFNDLLDILDKSIAKGIKDYMKVIENKKLDANENISKKIGRATIYKENMGGHREDDLYIKLNVLDVKDDKYRDIFNRVSNDKYILSDVITGEELEMINFANVNSFSHQTPGNLVRYNVYFDNEDIKKVNILMRIDKDKEIENNEIEVFNNLLKVLEIDKEDGKKLENYFKDAFVKKNVSKKISIDGYNINIKDNKGINISEEKSKLTYYSIEKNK